MHSWNSIESVPLPTQKTLYSSIQRRSFLLKAPTRQSGPSQIDGRFDDIIMVLGQLPLFVDASAGCILSRNLHEKLAWDGSRRNLVKVREALPVSWHSHTLLFYTCPGNVLNSALSGVENEKKSTLRRSHFPCRPYSGISCIQRKRAACSRHG